MRVGIRYDRALAVATPLALAAVGIAWRCGAPVGRMRPAALFLAASTAFALAREVTVQARVRRTRARAGSSIPWNVPLKEPFWSQISRTLAGLAVAGLLGAACCLAGSAGVGAGMSVTAALIAIGMTWALAHLEVRTVTFTAEGLHVALRRCRFIIGWRDVSGVETSRNGDLVELSVVSADRVAASAVPDDARGRKRVWSALFDGSGRTGHLLLDAALAGVDGTTLARTLREAVTRGAAVKPN